MLIEIEYYKKDTKLWGGKISFFRAEKKHRAGRSNS